MQFTVVKWQLCSCSCKFGSARVEKRDEKRAEIACAVETASFLMVELYM